MNSFEHERQPDREPCLYYLPVDDYSSEFQQLSVLQQRGYPIEMTVVPDNDEEMQVYFAQFSGAEIRDKEASIYPQWVKCTVDPDFDSLIVHPSTPGDTPQIDDEHLQRLLSGHPMQLIYDIDRAAVSALCHTYIVHILPAPPQDEWGQLAHERSDYPWLDVIGPCIVAAKLRYDYFCRMGVESYLAPTPPKPEVIEFADQLIRQGVRPINGERVAGLVSNYYNLVEQHFPKFKAFSP